MNNNVHKPYVHKKNIYRSKYLKKLFYKSIIVLALVLLLLLVKKVDYKATNEVLKGIKNNIEYEFDLINDSKKLYRMAQNLLDSSLEAVGVLNIVNPKYNAPITGTIYRSYDQVLIVDGNKVKNSGIDIKVINDDELKSISKGIITDVYKNGSKGYYISVRNDEMVITYGYISKPYIEKGDVIEVGEKIGELGKSKDGNTYLRIEIEVDGKKVDPMDYINLSESI